jgi:DNA-binding IclR family transcriptional regulator
LKVLELLSPARPQIGVSEVSRRLEIPKSSASRLLASLAEGGLLARDSRARTYGPGQLVRRLALLARKDASLLDELLGLARRLAESTRHSTWVGSLDGDEVIVLGNHHGGYAVRYVVEPGSRLPAHATALGKALLARMAPGEVRHLYASEALAARTARSIRNLDALLVDLARVRRRGYAISDEENFPGVKSIAASVSDADGHALALGISWPVSSEQRVQEARMVRELLACSRLLGA